MNLDLMWFKFLCIPIYIYLLMRFVQTLFYVTRRLSTHSSFSKYSVLVWSLDEYYIYAGCIAVTALISGGMNVYQIRKNMETLVRISDVSDLEQKKMATYSCEVEVVESNGKSTMKMSCHDLYRYC